jgi:hypothetical protein
MDENKSFDSSKESVTISTFKLQNRIEDTGSVITSMVVTDDDHLLLCDYNSGRLVAAYYPSGKCI